MLRYYFVKEREVLIGRKGTHHSDVRRELPPHYGALRLAGFAGYLLFLVSWLAVVVMLCYGLASEIFVSGQGVASTNSFVLFVQSGMRYGGTMAATGVFIMALSVLLLAYMFAIDYSVRIIHWLADVFRQSVWRVKLVGLFVGCVLATVGVFLLGTSNTSFWLVVGGGAIVVGLCSFGIEYACLKYWKIPTH